MARTLKYLTVEQQVAILEQRALELEAEYFATTKENELATKLGLTEIVDGTKAKAEAYAEALDSLEADIAALKGAEATPRASRRKKSS